MASGLGISGFALLSILGLRRAVADRAERRALRVLARRAEPAMSLADWSRQEVDRALGTLESDPHQAANTGALLLRTYMARRYGGGTDAATTEELERRAPTLAQRSLWPDFIRILRNFDDVRFRPGGDAEERRRRTRRALEDSLRLVDAAAGDPRRGDPKSGRNGRDVPRGEN